MRSIYLIAAAVGFLAFGMCARAEGAERKANPSVCVDYEIAQSKGGSFAVCYDGKKPTVYTMFSEVVVTAGDAENPTASRKVLVGYR